MFTNGRLSDELGRGMTAMQTLILALAAAV